MNESDSTRIMLPIIFSF
jgi:hypothetical protein